MSDLVKRERVPMAQAVQMLADLCERIDDGEAPTDAITKVFAETRLDLAEAVDRRIDFSAWIAGAISQAKEQRDVWADRARKLSAAEDAFKANTKAIMEAHPDLPYKGSRGRLALQANSQPTLKLLFGEKAVTPEVLSTFGIDDRFVKTKTVYEIDTQAVKAALQAGDKLPWAELSHGTHLRIKA